MVVGYSLGHKNNPEEEIKVLGEDEPNIITYSGCVNFVLSRLCRNECPYCDFQGKDKLTVPYSIIKMAKTARANGIRAAFFEAGERPDTFPFVRSTLDLWGFSSYLDYVYTVCELVFLEGLIPIIDIGFLTPTEMKKLSEICALIKIMLDPCEKNRIQSNDKVQEKKHELRIKSLQWAGKLKFPVITGLLVGSGETKAQRVEALETIAAIHKEYGHVHEVLLQNFIPPPGSAFANKGASRELMLETVKLAFHILPDDISIIVPIACNPEFKDFINAGIRDLGRIFKGKGRYPTAFQVQVEDFQTKVEEAGFTLQQRFPLKKSYIKNGFYSKKLGQVFDAYKYRLKKEEQERLKELKVNEASQ
ncbi:7,8-didemethyl-8-hydroxy-5-deazariboflavin synthase subunit CofG [Thermoproteota archaeon]